MEARRALEKLLPKEEVELLRLADESRKAEAELFEHRFKHYELEDKADALANEWAAASQRCAREPALSTQGLGVGVCGQCTRARVRACMPVRISVCKCVGTHTWVCAYERVCERLTTYRWMFAGPVRGGRDASPRSCRRH